MAKTTATNGEKCPAVFLPVVFSEEEKTNDESVVIHLDEAERNLLAIVQSATRNLSSPVRIAGGWVRDKILGIDSDDIDLAIENHTGVEFAKILQKELVSRGCEPRKIGVIAANPAQSKHLETACMNVGGLDLDLCHLRSHEVYSVSRIPDSVSFGSPLEDAERRDFTCNALFYNIETQQIEDWTGRGWSDLKNGVLNTPLEPLTTFLDDPLRVLRAIRFAVRYNYVISAADTIRNEASIRKALLEKVSRERVGKELEGMLSGKFAKPAVALKMIVDLGLADVVFAMPEAADHIHGWQDDGLVYLGRVEWAIDELKRATALVGGTPTVVDERLLPLLALLLPLRKGTYFGKKNKVYLIVQYIFAEALKFSKKDADAAHTVFTTLDRFLDLMTLYSKVQAGLLLRETKGLWVTTFALAAIESHKIDIPSEYNNFQPLDECWKIRPLLDGKSLIKELELKAGPSVGKYMQEQVVWMIENPLGSKDDCLKHLQKKRKVLA